MLHKWQFLGRDNICFVRRGWREKFISNEVSILSPLHLLTLPLTSFFSPLNHHHFFLCHYLRISLSTSRLIYTSVYLCIYLYLCRGKKAIYLCIYLPNYLHPNEEEQLYSRRSMRTTGEISNVALNFMCDKLCKDNRRDILNLLCLDVLCNCTILSYRFFNKNPFRSESHPIPRKCTQTYWEQHSLEQSLVYVRDILYDESTW